MKVQIRAVGKLRDKRIESLCGDYLDRARRHLTISVQDVADEAGLWAGLPSSVETVALDPEGAAWDTLRFASYIEDHMLHARVNTVAFFIGAADGLSDETRTRVDRKLSLSPMTLPHRLARLFLCEQLYRVLSHIRGEPYNK